MSDLERAVAFATEAHAGQVDKLGEPYIDHCLRVMDAVSEPAKRVAVLHDVVEDTEASLMDVFLLVESVVETTAVERLTRWPGTTYEQYIRLLVSGDSRASQLAREVKVADLRDNLGRWVPDLGEDLKRRYERALVRLTEEKA